MNKNWQNSMYQKFWLSISLFLRNSYRIEYFSFLFFKTTRMRIPSPYLDFIINNCIILRQINTPLKDTFFEKIDISLVSRLSFIQICKIIISYISNIIYFPLYFSIPLEFTAFLFASESCILQKVELYFQTYIVIFSIE